MKAGESAFTNPRSRAMEEVDAPLTEQEKKNALLERLFGGMKSENSLDSSVLSGVAGWMFSLESAVKWNGA